jgi:putative alpha-1,2-mannosidase
VESVDNSPTSFVPHDIARIIELMGGPDNFMKRLDYFHTSGLADISNEPVFLTVFLYHYAGRPGLSARRAHSYIPSSFNDSTSTFPILSPFPTSLALY